MSQPADGWAWWRATATVSAGLDHRREREGVAGHRPADFTATAPGCKLVGDITYIPTLGGVGPLLATVLDCFSKKVVGYAMADHMRTSLVTEALQMTSNNVGFTSGEKFPHHGPGIVSPSK